MFLERENLTENEISIFLALQMDEAKQIPIFIDTRVHFQGFPSFSYPTPLPLPEKSINDEFHFIHVASYSHYLFSHYS